jgi:DNA-binding response OmpR family regulator
MAPKRVLVIDDSPTITKVVQLTLAKARYQVVTADGGAAGVAAARAEKPDLILLDWVMPEMDGEKVLHALHDDAELSKIPVVLISAKGETLNSRIHTLGVVDAVTKPFAAEALLAVTEHALERYAGGGAAADVEAAEAAAGLSPREEDDSPVDVEFEKSLDKTPADPFGYEVSGPVIETLHREAQAAGPPRRSPKTALSALRRELAAMVAPDLVGAVKEGGTPDALETRVTEAIARALPDDTLAEHVRKVLKDNPTFYTDDGIGLMGDLSCVGLGDVFRLVAQFRRTGVLHVFKEEMRVEVSFTDGKIDLATATGYEEEFLLGRFIIEAGLMSRSDLDNFLQNRAGSSKLLGRQLVKLGFIPLDGLKDAIRRQTQEILYELMRWDRGRFHFHTDRPPGPLAREAGLGLGVDALLLEGIRRVDEWYLIEQKVQNFDETYTRNEEVVTALGKERFTREESQMLELVNGKNTVRDILKKSRMGSYDVSKLLYRLLSIGAIRPRVAPVAV